MDEEDTSSRDVLSTAVPLRGVDGVAPRCCSSAAGLAFVRLRAEPLSDDLIAYRRGNGMPLGRLCGAHLGKRRPLHRSGKIMKITGLTVAVVALGLAACDTKTENAAQNETNAVDAAENNTDLENTGEGALNSVENAAEDAGNVIENTAEDVTDEVENRT